MEWCWLATSATGSGESRPSPCEFGSTSELNCHLAVASPRGQLAMSGPMKTMKTHSYQLSLQDLDQIEEVSPSVNVIHM